jgi:hypothetical protein
MGTYLTAELQENRNNDCAQNRWETVATFEFWKDYSLMSVLDDHKPGERFKPYGVDDKDVGEYYQTFAPEELPAMGHEPPSTLYLALIAATTVFCRERGDKRVRVVFWRS